MFVLKPCKTGHCTHCSLKSPITSYDTRGYVVSLEFGKEEQLCVFHLASVLRDRLEEEEPLKRTRFEF